MKDLEIDLEYLHDVLIAMLAIPSPVGYTDEIVHFVGSQLVEIGIPFEITRRGAIRADLNGTAAASGRAVVTHLDTLGAMVKQLKDNGRLGIWPIGHWNARFAAGARVTVFTDKSSWRGTILPLKASGHTYADEVDTQPSNWDHVEIRVDDLCYKKEDLLERGFNIGDYIAIDTQPEVTETGYINSRHLDNKAGTAALLAMAKAVKESKVPIDVDCHLLFTISEEVGSGASAVLHGDIAEMVSIDNSTPAPGQNSTELGVTVGMMDLSGPFDFHLTRKLLSLCQDYKIEHTRDIFKFYKTDAASAVEAGNDIRTALVCFGADASHGWERTHIRSLEALARLLALYVQTPLTFQRDRIDLGPMEGFPTQPQSDIILGK